MDRSRTDRLLAAVAMSVISVVLSGCVVPPPNAPQPLSKAPVTGSRPSPRVVVYGDSLTAESRSAVQRRLGETLVGWKVDVRSFGGTAQCDWHDAMRADATALRPAVVVIAFSGNQLTECATSRPYPDQYAADAEWAAAHWTGHGTKVVFVGAPPPVGSSSSAVADLYHQAALGTGAQFVSADRLFLDPGTGTATMDLACGPTDGVEQGCVAGSIRVRATDGVHFCPVPLTFEPCPVHSAGVERYADTITEGAASAAGVPFRRMTDAASPPLTSA